MRTARNDLYVLLLVAGLLNGLPGRVDAEELRITSRIPGGNIEVVSVNGHEVTLAVEQRDTQREWFYWCFEAVFPEASRYRFRFTRPNKVGTRGPAISLDGGESWRWRYGEHWENTQEFDYECPEAGQKVIFCMGMQYLERDFARFHREFAAHPALQVGTLCRSRKGRDVELVTIREGEPEYHVLLTSRHHAGEMMATHVLEGILRAVLADTEFGRAFRERIAVYAVPFVDKDGVEEGDQGKDRAPHDHARDYLISSPLYPETAAIRALIDREKTDVVLDLHCPWIRGGATNEITYMVGTGNAKMDEQMERFGALLEEEQCAEAPYFQKDNVPFGTLWNTPRNYTQGKTIKHYAATRPFVLNAQTIEIPFANFRDITVDRDSMLRYGASIAQALYRYLTGGKAAGESRRASLSFTGDVMCQLPQLSACRTPDGFDFRAVFASAAKMLGAADYLVGNLETPFAGEAAGYTGRSYSFNTPDEFARTLREAGFDLVSTANNHCLDRGLPGLKRTLEVLDQAGIAHTGTARSWKERNRIFMQLINGIRVAFISYTYGTNGFANHTFLKLEELYAVNLLQPQETQSGSIHLLDPAEMIERNMLGNRTREAPSPYLEQLRGDIAECRSAGADFVIVLLHCGGQYNPQPDPYTEFIIGKLREFGADMVIGNHPHVVHKADLGNGIPVFYSLGNFTYTPGESPGSRRNPISATSLLLTTVLEKNETGTMLAAVSVSPMRSVIREDGKSVVVPVADLLKSETDPDKRRLYADDLRRVLNTFLNRPADTPVELRDVYAVPMKTISEDAESTQPPVRKHNISGKMEEPQS